MRGLASGVRRSQALGAVDGGIRETASQSCSTLVPGHALPVWTGGAEQAGQLHCGRPTTGRPLQPPRARRPRACRWLWQPCALAWACPASTSGAITHCWGYASGMRLAGERGDWQPHRLATDWQSRSRSYKASRPRSFRPFHPSTPPPPPAPGSCENGGSVHRRSGWLRPRRPAGGARPPRPPGGRGRRQGGECMPAQAQCPTVAAAASPQSCPGALPGAPSGPPAGPDGMPAPHHAHPSREGSHIAPATPARARRRRSAR